MAWPCTTHKQSYKSSAKKSQKMENTKLGTNNMTQSPWVPNASKGKLNLSLLQDLMALSFSMQSHAS